MKRALGQIRANLPLGLCINSRFSIENIATARLSVVFKTMLPTKPSQNDDVHVVLEQIMPLDVADEIQVELPAELEGRQGKFVALGILGADAQNADARPLRPSTSRE